MKIVSNLNMPIFFTFREISHERPLRFIVLNDSVSPKMVTKMYFGPVPTKDVKTPPPPSEVAILTKNIANMMKIKMGAKYHITSYRV